MLVIMITVLGYLKVKLELAWQSFYFYRGKLYNKLPIGIQKLDAISEFKVALRGHFLWHSYLTLVHRYMFFISTSIFSGLSFFLSYIPYIFLSFSEATIYIPPFVSIQCFKLMACYSNCSYYKFLLFRDFRFNILRFFTEQALITVYFILTEAFYFYSV